MRKDVLDNSTVAERRSLSASKRGCHNLRRSMQTNVLADLERQLTYSSALNPASNTSLNLPELQNKVRGSTPPNLLYLFNSPPAPPVLKRQQQRAPTNSRRNKCEITMHRAEIFIWPHQLCTELNPHPWKITPDRPLFSPKPHIHAQHSTANDTREPHEGTAMHNIATLVVQANTQPCCASASQPARR